MKDEFYRKEYDSEGRKLPKQIMAAEVRTPSIVVVDHFYNDPDEVRNWAIGECHFQEPGTHGAVGYRCEEECFECDGKWRPRSSSRYCCDPPRSPGSL